MEGSVRSLHLARHIAPPPPKHTRHSRDKTGTGVCKNLFWGSALTGIINWPHWQECEAKPHIQPQVCFHPCRIMLCLYEIMQSSGALICGTNILRQVQEHNFLKNEQMEESETETFYPGPLVKRVVINRWQFSISIIIISSRHLLDQSEQIRNIDALLWLVDNIKAKG